MITNVAVMNTRQLNFAAAKAAGIKVMLSSPNEWVYIPKGKRTHYKWEPTHNWKQTGILLKELEAEGSSFSVSYVKSIGRAQATWIKGGCGTVRIR